MDYTILPEDIVSYIHQYYNPYIELYNRIITDIKNPVYRVRDKYFKEFYDTDNDRTFYNDNFDCIDIVKNDTSDYDLMKLNLIDELITHSNYYLYKFNITNYTLDEFNDIIHDYANDIYMTMEQANYNISLMINVDLLLFDLFNDNFISEYLGDFIVEFENYKIYRRL